MLLHSLSLAGTTSKIVLEVLITNFTSTLMDWTLLIYEIKYLRQNPILLIIYSFKLSFLIIAKLNLQRRCEEHSMNFEVMTFKIN